MELASWTATSSADETKTKNVNIDAAMVPRTACTVSVELLPSHWSSSSSQCRKRTATMAAIMLSNGQIQIEFVS
jgi:hypothetical protein